MAELSKAILAGEDIRKNALIEKHADWVDSWIGNYEITAENITEILHDEISKVFVKVLLNVQAYISGQKRDRLRLCGLWILCRNKD